MRRSRWLLVVSFVVISSMLAWACGGGEKEEPGAATAPAATSPASKTPEAKETPKTQEGGGEFGDLAGRFGKATFKVTYDLSSGSGEQGFTGTMTLYKKGDNLREDFEGESGGEKTSATFITTPDKSYVCTEVPEMGEGGTCFSAPSEPGQGPTEIVADLEKALTDPNVDIVSTSSRKIAGEDAKCYTVRSSELEGESELCMSDEGVPLFSKSTVEGAEMSLEATDFSRDVSDDDFEPPYPVSEELPGQP
jgi:hypothetical protein